jgi:hypothetical protein
LKNISERILAKDDHAEALAGLVDAIGKSRAMVQYSYNTNSANKLQDWREALKVLEAWSAAEKPWDWKKSTSEADMTKEAGTSGKAPTRKHASEGDVAKESGSSANTSTWRNAVLERELGSWLVKLMSKLVYSHTYLVRSLLDTIPKQFGIKATVEMHLVSHYYRF